MARVAIRHDIDEKLGLTVVVWDGDCSEHETLDHLVRLAEDTRWPPGPRQVSDIRTLNRATMPPRDLVAELIAGTDLHRTLKRVVVARPSRVESGNIPSMASVFGMNDATTFTDLDAACAHLGIDAATCRSMVDGIREGLAEHQSLA
ncbi:MAG TPA: hypothetical protein VNC41_18910 [Acidimicrobiia bacterium]|nr:hypothetical protein [Acidimicrobiia bacterium]